MKHSIRSFASISILALSGAMSLGDVKDRMSQSSFRRWMIQTQAGQEIKCNSKLNSLKEQFLLAYAFEAKRQVDKKDVLDAVGGVSSKVDRVGEKVDKVGSTVTRVEEKFDKMLQAVAGSTPSSSKD